MPLPPETKNRQRTAPPEVNSIEKQLGGMATATERQELETLKVKVAKQRAGGQAETGSTLGSLQANPRGFL